MTEEERRVALKVASWALRDKRPDRESVRRETLEVLLMLGIKQP